MKLGFANGEWMFCALDLKDRIDEIRMALFEEWNMSQDNAKDMANGNIFKMLVIKVIA